jgi:hypothetical protein
VPPQTVDPVVRPIVTSLLGDMMIVFNQLDTLNGDPLRPVCLKPGSRPVLLVSQSEDECCSRLVWLRPGRLYPSSQSAFPAPDDIAAPCDVRRWAVELELGASRCAPTGTDTSLPTCAEQIATTLASLDDAAALRRSLLLWQQTHPYDTIKIEAQEPGDVEGGCAHVTLSIIVAAPAADCWEEV